MVRRFIIHVASAAAVLASVYYLYLVYVDNSAALNQWQAPDWIWAAALCGVLFYICLMSLQSEAWHRLLLFIGCTQTGRRNSYASFLGSQLGKYLPGGVLHYAGRHVWLRRRGLDHKGLIKAAMVETALMGLFAGVLACLFQLFITGAGGMTLPQSALVPDFLASAHIPGFMFTVLAAGGVVAVGVLYVYLRRSRPVGQGIEFVLACGSVVAFFILQGVLFLMASAVVLGAVHFPLMPAFLFAWIAGFVVVGAPGGLGVREATLVLLAGPVISPEEALLCGAFFRLICMAGEVLAYFIALRIGRPMESSSDR